MNQSDLQAAVEHLRKGIGILAGGPLDHFERTLVGCHRLLLTRFAPFRKGDQVMLIKTPEISETKSSGWLPYKGILVQGAVGTIEEVEVDGDGFSAGVVIAGEGQFWFREKSLMRMPESAPQDGGSR